MNRNASLVRKAIYGGVMLLLLVPLFQLGQPATYDSSGRQLSGGQLAEMRTEHSLAQASLGEIDPASESMKLATLGMRGVAANILWDRATEFEKKEDWDALSATLNQITKLQPNFITVWEHQGHNLSYNVSVEFDDFRHRYHWVKKGIDFMIRGTGYNREEARLYHSIGWFFGHKIGRADEHLQFRRLFRTDRDYHSELDAGNHVDMENPEVRSRHDQLPDNWLVARQWFIKGETILDTSGRPLRGKSPLVVHSDRPKALINSAEAAENEGHFGEYARQAWSDALEEWLMFGDRPIPSSWGFNLQLNDYPRAKEEVAELEQQLNDLAPGAREQIYQEKLASLTPAEAAVVDATPLELMQQLSNEEAELHYVAKAKLKITDQEIADRVPSESREKAKRLVTKLESMRTFMGRIGRYRDQVNFDYWETRCRAEQTAEATQAREYLYEADKLFKRTKLEEAKEAYTNAWQLWAGIIKQYPILQDDLSSDALRNGMIGYLETLGQLGEDLPEDFPLRFLMEGEAAKELDFDFGSGGPPGVR